MNKFSFLFFVAAQLAATHVFADVEINTTEVRNYQLPGVFEIAGSQLQLGPNDTTILTNTMGANADESACGIVFASNDSANLLEYRYNDQPTACIASLPHPEGGVFIRGVDPTAEAGTVAGFTAFISADAQEVWAIPDQRLVDAQPEPTGTGQFQGAYQQPDRTLAYSPQSDKLLAFSVGKLDLGVDEKFITQAHVINVDSGALTVTGQTFGQSGVGFVGGATVRASDGDFLIYYFSSGSQGAFFYEYDGRSDIEFFKPRGEDWDDRFVIRMIYSRDLLHLLWTPTGELGTETRLTTTTDAAAELWSEVYSGEYTFADGRAFLFGPPVTMWVGAEQTAILYQIETSFFLRVVDINGISAGFGSLDDVAAFPAVGILNAANGGFRLMAYDDTTRFVYEYDLELKDVDDFDPDAGPTIPGDAGIPSDIGLGDALKAAGCCATTRAQTPWFAFMILGAFILVRNRRD